MAPKKAKGSAAKAARAGAGDTDGACKLHVAMARPGMNLNSKSYVDSIMAALKEDVADGNGAAVSEPIPRLGYTVLQLAISSGAGQLVKKLLAEDVLDISRMDKANLSNGQLTLLHEAVQSDSDEVLNAILESPRAADFSNEAIEISSDEHTFVGVTPVVYLALLPAFCPNLSMSTDSCKTRASMLGRLLGTYGQGCGSLKFKLKDGSTEMSAITVAALLCHGFPMEEILSELVRTYGSILSMDEVDAAAVASAAKAWEPVCPALMEKVTDAAASMVTSPASVAAVPIPQTFWLGAAAILIARGKFPTECGFDSSMFSDPCLMAVHMTTPPKGLALTRMLPSQFYTFWASLNVEFAASESSLDHFKAAAQQFGLEALYLARAIPESCPLRDRWIKACVPPASAGHTLGSLLAASIHVPSPLKLNVMPAEFERIWFPGCAVVDAGGDDSAGADGGADLAEEYRSDIWRKFMLGRDVPVLSAVLAEGMAGDGKVVQALLASATGTDEDEDALGREVYDSCNSVPDVVGAVLRQVAAEPGSMVPLDKWSVESMQGDGGLPLSENCTCTPMLEFVQSVNRWEHAEDARLALEALVSKARALSGPALSGAPVCNLMPWTSDLLPVPGSAEVNKDGKPTVPGAEHLSSTASQADVDLGRALVGAASGIIAGRPEPDPDVQKTAPIAFKVLQWLLNLDGPALAPMREQLGFPFHLRGLDQDSGDLLIEALCGTSPDVLHLIVQHIADNDFKTTAPWANVNMAALACFRGWPEGVAAVLAAPSVDPMAPINEANDSPLHWLCKAGSSWAKVPVNGMSVEVDSATTALMPPGDLKPAQIRGLITELAAHKDGEMANALDCANRTPLFYAHSAAAIEALLDAGCDVNARDCDNLDCIAFRITETMDLDSAEFDLSIKDQIRAIVSHHSYNHQAHFEMKSENTEVGEEGKEVGAVCVEKYARDYCPQDPEIELIMHTTNKMKDLFRIRLPDIPRMKILNHVKTWMAFISKDKCVKEDLYTGDLLVKIQQTEPNIRKRFLSSFLEYCRFPKEELENWDAESASYFMTKFQKAIDDDEIPLDGHHHTICFAETMLEDVNERFGREALKTVLAFRKADWDEALEFMKPKWKSDDPENEHPPVTLYEFLKQRGVSLKELPDPTKETPGCTVPLAQKKKHKLLPPPDASAAAPQLDTGPKSKVKSGFKRGFFGKAPEKRDAAAGKDPSSASARPAWVEKCSKYGSDVLKGVEKTEMRKRIVACMGHKDAKAKDENGAVRRLLAFYDSTVDARSASMSEVSSIAMPPKTKPSLKLAQWLKAEGTDLMAEAKKKTKPKTLGAPLPDNHKFAALKCTMWEGAWTMYYLSCCVLLDVIANGKEALGEANVTTAGDEYCKCLSNMAQACINAASTGKEYQRGDKIAQANLREMLMSAVATATAALACANIDNVADLANKSRKRVKQALAMLAEDTQSEQARHSSKNMDAYCAELEK